MPPCGPPKSKGVSHQSAESLGARRATHFSLPVFLAALEGSLSVEKINHMRR